MPAQVIHSVNPITIPPGPDKLRYDIHLTSRISPPNGVVDASATGVFRHYRSNDDGTGSVDIGAPTAINVSSVDKQAQTDADFATLLATLNAAVAAFVAAKGL
jgi:hypothetical protein